MIKERIYQGMLDYLKSLDFEKCVDILNDIGASKEDAIELGFSDSIAEQLEEDEECNRDILSPETANAVYTGGGCWIFYGKCNEDGRWYMLSDTGFLLITDENPDNFDESLDIEWQEKHTVQEIEGKERYDFSMEVLSILKDLVKQKKYEKTGGLFEREIEFYEIVFKNLSEE